ncbi:MAG: substrate-binding domain-containing protein [Phycisphaerales bacterium]|nr:substrate-binding domain-containing protein [Phycisphaerales bacterium]
MKKKSWILFVGNLAISYNRAILRGISHALERDPALEHYAVCHVEARDIKDMPFADVVGMLISGVDVNESYFTELAEAGMPMVGVAGDRHRAWLGYHVGADDIATGRLAAEHLISRGFTRFGYLGARGHLAMAQRQEGFIAQLAEVQLKAVCFETPLRSASWLSWPRGMQAWAQRVAKPAAVFCCNDQRANSLLIACVRAGIRVPEDIAVVGVDDDDIYATMRRPHLSSIQLQMQVIADKSVEMLVKLIRREVPPVKMLMVGPGTLVVRGSSNIVAADDPLVRSALTLIHQRIARGISVKTLTASLNISRPTLETRFQAALRRSPAAEIRRQQLEKAKTLLATTRLPMPEVAEQAGYTSGKHLSIAFRRDMGTTPTAYRRDRVAASEIPQPKGSGQNASTGAASSLSEES